MKKLLLLSFTFLIFSCEQKEKPLTSDELSDKSLKELRIIRNEIFARHGYKFKSEDLNSYFSSKDWYKPEYDDVTDQLTDLEKANIAIILDQEKKMKKRLTSLEKIDIVKYEADSLDESTQEILNNFLTKNKSEFISGFTNFWNMKFEPETFDVRVMAQELWSSENNTFVSIKIEVKAKIASGGIAVANNNYLLRFKDDQLSILHDLRFYQPECGTPDYNITGVSTLILGQKYEMIDLETEIAGCCGASDERKVDWLMFVNNFSQLQDTLHLTYLNKHNDECSSDNLIPVRRETIYYYGEGSEVLAKTNFFEGGKIKKTEDKLINL